MLLFTFSVLDSKHPFLNKFGPKIKNCQFKLKFGLFKLVQQNSMVVLTFSVLDRKHPFFRKFGQKLKTLSV